MIDEKFNATMDKVVAKGIRFAPSPVQNAVRFSGIPYGYFRPSVWESFKRVFGLM